MQAGEVHLWRSVVLRAFCDATMRVKNPERKLRLPRSAKRLAALKVSDHNVAVLRQEARNWLLKDTEVFPFVCHLALLAPDKVRASAQRLKARHWVPVRSLTERSASHRAVA